MYAMEINIPGPTNPA